MLKTGWKIFLDYHFLSPKEPFCRKKFTFYKPPFWCRGGGSKFSGMIRGFLKLDFAHIWQGGGTHMTPSIRNLPESSSIGEKEIGMWNPSLIGWKHFSLTAWLINFRHWSHHLPHFLWFSWLCSGQILRLLNYTSLLSDSLTPSQLNFFIWRAAEVEILSDLIKVIIQSCIVELVFSYYLKVGAPFP